MDQSSPADRLELEIGTVRIPFELLTFLTPLGSETFRGDREPQVVSNRLALIYPQLNRIVEEAILGRGMELHWRADFGFEMVEGIRGQGLRTTSLPGHSESG